MLRQPEAMRFWNHPVHAKRIETERAVRRFMDCTPSYYRFWAVADAKTGRCFGTVNYHDGHMRNKRVTIGYIATEAVSAMLDFCFSELRLHRVQAFIHPDNIASRKPVEKLGFRSKGLLRGNLRTDGEMLFALLETDWRS
jgi:[ribosomal protein S5]-alanine N-acetyltransferase